MVPVRTMSERRKSECSEKESGDVERHGRRQELAGGKVRRRGQEEGGCAKGAGGCYIYLGRHVRSSWAIRLMHRAEMKCVGQGAWKLEGSPSLVWEGSLPRWAGAQDALPSADVRSPLAV